LYSGGLIEQYWWNENIENQLGPDGKKGLYEIFSYFNDFLSEIPLNSGTYANAQAVVTNPNLRVVGQKDVTNLKAHLWVQNKEHTWRNVVDGVEPTIRIDGSISIDGFPPNTALKVKWYLFTTQGIPTIETTDTIVDQSGRVTLQLSNDPTITDIAIRIYKAP
jgi:hypothetical protein